MAITQQIKERFEERYGVIMDHLSDRIAHDDYPPMPRKYSPKFEDIDPDRADLENIALLANW